MDAMGISRYTAICSLSTIASRTSAARAAARLRQTAEGQALEFREHIRLRLPPRIRLRARLQHGHADIAPVPAENARLVREVRAPTRLDVLRERVPQVPREDPLVVGRVGAVVDRRVVHVQDRAVRQDGRGLEVGRGGEERLDEVRRERRVETRGERGGRVGVRAEGRVGDLGPGGAREGSGWHAELRSR